MALGFLAKGLLGAGKVVGKGVGLAGRGALMAGRAGMALRGRRRKINPAKLMGTEDNVSGRKNVEKGGALMILPSGDLVAYSKGDISTKSQKPNEDVVYTIHEKVIEIDKFLKGTVAAEKIEQKKEQQKKEKERRGKKEDKLEKPDKGDEDKETPKPLLPKIGFLERIKQFITKVLVGWVVFNLIKFLPKIMGILKWIGKIGDFIFWLGGKFLNGLVTMVHWGYKAFEWTRGAIGSVFGEKGLKVFDGISGVLNSVLNWTMSLGLAMIALSDEFGTNLFDLGKNFLRLFKRGLGQRLLTRTLIQTLGKKGATTVLTKLGLKSAVTAGTTSAVTGGTVAGGTVAGGTGGGLGIAGVAKVAGIVLSASGVATVIGEGGAQILKFGKHLENNAVEASKKAKDTPWWNPMKYWHMATSGVLGIVNRLSGATFGLFDILGTPFRLLIEAIRWPFMNEDQRKKAGLNLEKFDARLREQFRGFFNMFDFLNVVPDQPGSWGSIGWWGDKDKAQEELGYTEDGKPKKAMTLFSKESDEEIEKLKADTTEKNKFNLHGAIAGGSVAGLPGVFAGSAFAADMDERFMPKGKKTTELESKKPKGLWRGITGAADFMTGGMWDFDQRNREGAPKDFGIRRIAGGLADWATMGLTDFDKRGAGNLQFDPIGGGKDKAWGSRDEQAKRREKQSGFGLKRGIGGALDFATFGMFDFDKQNRRGAPKGFGIKRIAGGLADVLTGGTTDFDKRGSGLLQYSGFTVRRGMQRPMRSEYHQRKIDDLQSRFNQIPMETTVNPDGSITSRGSGRLIAGELFRPGQPLSENQYAMIKYGIMSGNQYPDEVMKSYNLYEIEQNRVKGNSNNIMPLDVNSVAKKINNVSSSASYEDDAEQTVVIPSRSQEQSLTENESKTEQKMVTVAVGSGGGDSEVSDALYMGG